MLRNPVYTGSLVWNRLDFTERQEAGGGARRRAREEWVVAEEAHLPLVSDETYEAAQERFDEGSRGKGSLARRSAPTCSRAWCAAAPATSRCRCRAGPARATTTTPAPTATNYGETAAIEAHGGQKWVYVREDWLAAPGPAASSSSGSSARCASSASRSSCAPTPASSAANGKLAGTRMRQQIAELDRKIKAQVQALEKGIEPELVSERIAELRGEKEALEEALAEIGAERQEAEEEELSEQLARIPDLTEALREAPAEIKRQVFESFDLQIAYDKAERTDRNLGNRLRGRRRCLRERESPPKEGSSVVLRDIAGARYVSRYDARIVERVRLAA